MHRLIWFIRAKCNMCFHVRISLPVLLQWKWRVEIIKYFVVVLFRYLLFGVVANTICERYRFDCERKHLAWFITIVARTADGDLWLQLACNFAELTYFCVMTKGVNWSPFDWISGFGCLYSIAWLTAGSLRFDSFWLSYALNINACDCLTTCWVAQH